MELFRFQAQLLEREMAWEAEKYSLALKKLEMRYILAYVYLFVSGLRNLPQPGVEPGTLRSTANWTNSPPWRGQRVSQSDWKPFQSQDLLHSKGANSCQKRNDWNESNKSTYTTRMHAFKMHITGVTRAAIVRRCWTYTQLFSRMCDECKESS